VTAGRPPSTTNRNARNTVRVTDPRCSSASGVPVEKRARAGVRRVPVFTRSDAARSSWIRSVAIAGLLDAGDAGVKLANLGGEVDALRQVETIGDSPVVESRGR
jgi:hypothetical protein